MLKLNKLLSIFTFLVRAKGRGMYWNEVRGTKFYKQAICPETCDS